MTFLLRAFRPALAFPLPQSLITHPDVVDGQPGIDSRRFVPLEGGVNFRDLGGYTTNDGRRLRWGRVYRTGTLAKLTPHDIEVVAQLGIKLVCDLRTADEVSAAPEPLDGVDNFHMSIEEENATPARLRALLFDRKRLPDLMLKFYTEVAIDKNAAIFGNVFQRLADPANLPMLIRCTAGKDRTGITVALLLLGLGVAEETVIADYSLSNLYFEDFQAFAQQAIKPLRVVGISVRDLQPLLVADPNTLRRTIAYVRNEYGSVEAYLRDKASVDAATLERVRDNLLEE